MAKKLTCEACWREESDDLSVYDTIDPYDWEICYVETPVIYCSDCLQARADDI